MFFFSRYIKLISVLANYLSDSTCLINCIDIHAQLQQYFHYSQMTVTAGQKQGVLPVAPREIDIGPRFDEELHRWLLSVSTSPQQSCHVICVNFIDITSYEIAKSTQLCCNMNQLSSIIGQKAFLGEGGDITIIQRHHFCQGRATN